MREFITNINTNRFEIPQSFCNNCDINFNSNDVLLLNINGNTVIGTINVHKDKKSLRKRIRIFNDYFDNIKIGRNTIEILQQIKEGSRDIDYNNFLVKHQNKNYLDLYKIIPVKNHKGSLIKLLEHNNKMYLFKPSSEKVVAIKRFVDYYNFLEILGLYQGEGLRSIKHCRKLQFANNKEEIVNKFLDFFEEIGLPRNSWKAFISLTGYVDKERKEYALNYWSNKIKIPKDNFRKGSNTKTYGKMHNKEGTVAVVFDSSPLASCFLGILKNVRKIIRYEKEAWYFIKGLLEADGSVNIKKDGKLSDLSIAYDKLEEVLVYQDIMENKLNIKTKIDKNSRSIYFLKDKNNCDKWITWYKAIKHNCFEYHQERKIKLFKGFLNHKRTKIFFRILNQFKNKELRTIEILKLTEYKYKRSVIVNFKNLEKLGFVNIKRIKNYNVYNINQKGKEFLNIYNKISNFFQNRRDI